MEITNIFSWAWVKERKSRRERERAEAKNKRPGLPSSSVSVHFTFSLWVSSLFTQRVFGASPIHQHAIYRFFKTSKNTTAKRRQVGSRYTDIGYSTVKEKIYFLESKWRKKWLVDEKWCGMTIYYHPADGKVNLCIWLLPSLHFHRAEPKKYRNLLFSGHCHRNTGKLYSVFFCHWIPPSFFFGRFPDRSRGKSSSLDPHCCSFFFGAAVFTFGLWRGLLLPNILAFSRRS